ncbi:unnamed protein product [Effrenium voratum]|uniref:Uncharacterized protein n=1 Tax=Effrenium voratum TaxID=2562239 RepID=A0AA36I5C1_9DINO|nr:unnamed protein product [Effrenium voratum]
MEDGCGLRGFVGHPLPRQSSGAALGGEPPLRRSLCRLGAGRERSPQAIVVSLPQKMKVGSTYDCLCYLDEASKKAVYVLQPAGSANPSDCVLCVMALYNWSSLPADGATLSAEDVELPNSGAARGNLVKFALGGEVKPLKLLDLSSVKKL